MVKLTVIDQVRDTDAQLSTLVTEHVTQVTMAEVKFR